MSTTWAIVDEDWIARAGLAALLQSLFDSSPQLEQFSTVFEARRRFEHAGWPRLLLLNVDQPGSVDFARSALVRTQGPAGTTAVVALSASCAVPAARDALRAGITNLLVKRQGVHDDLRRTIECALAGGSSFPSDVLMAVMSSVERGADHRTVVNAMTSRERDVFDALMRGLQTKLIARELQLSETRVKKLIHAVFQRFGVRTRAQLMANARADDPGVPTSATFGEAPTRLRVVRAQLPA